MEQPVQPPTPRQNNNSQLQNRKPTYIEPPKRRTSRALVFVFALLLLFAAAGAAWWYGQSQERKTLQPQIDSLQKQVEELKKLQSNSAQTDDSDSPLNNNSGYLVIEEWGVRIPITNDIKDAKYVIDNIALRLYTQTMATINKRCEDQGMVGIVRNPQTSEFYNNSRAIKIKGNRYFVDGPQSPCTLSESNKVDPNEAKIVTSLKTAAEKIEAAQ